MAKNPHIRNTKDIDSRHAEAAGACLRAIQQRNLDTYDAQAVLALMAAYLVGSMGLDARNFANTLHKNVIYMNDSPQTNASRHEFMNIINREVSSTKIFLPPKGATKAVSESKVN